jgi:hypothetical protein
MGQLIGMIQHGFSPAPVGFPDHKGYRHIQTIASDPFALAQKTAGRIAEWRQNCFDMAFGSVALRISFERPAVKGRY